MEGPATPLKKWLDGWRNKLRGGGAVVNFDQLSGRISFSCLSIFLRDFDARISQNEAKAAQHYFLRR